MITAVDFSNNWIKLVKADAAAGQPRLVTDAAARRFPDDMDDKTLRKELHKFVCSVLGAKPKEVISCIPRQSATIRFLRLPSADEKEIENMLEFQATKQLPFFKEDIIIGHKIIKIDEDGYSKVMLVVAQKAVIDSHFSLLNSAGLFPGFVALSSEAVFSLLLRSSAHGKKFLSQDFLCAILDVDYLSTELLISEAGNIVFSRAFSYGAAMLNGLNTEAGASRWAGGLIDHVKRTLMAFQKDRLKTDNSKAIKNIFVSGGVSEISKYIQNDLYKEFNVPVEYINALEDLGIVKDYKAAGEVVGEPVSFSGAMGAALDKDSLNINLLPGGLKAKLLLKQKWSDLARIYILCISILSCIFILIGSRLYYKQAYLKYLDKEMSAVKPYVDKIELLTQRLNIIKNQADKNNAPLETLKEVYNLIPKDMSLYALSFTENNNVVLRGTSRAMGAVFEAVSALEKSKHFKNVKLTFAAKRKMEKEEIVDFQVNCVLRQ